MVEIVYVPSLLSSSFHRLLLLLLLDVRLWDCTRCLTALPKICGFFVLNRDLRSMFMRAGFELVNIYLTGNGRHYINELLRIVFVCFSGI